MNYIKFQTELNNIVERFKEEVRRYVKVEKDLEVEIDCFQSYVVLYAEVEKSEFRQEIGFNGREFEPETIQAAIW